VPISPSLEYQPERNRRTYQAFEAVLQEAGERVPMRLLLLASMSAGDTVNK